MDPKGYLERFAQVHVNPAFRERFVHEALRKPGKLQTRICHTISDVFPLKCRDGKLPFRPEDSCVAICGVDDEDHLVLRTWRELARYERSSFGLLVGSLDALQFYAETEFEFRSPSILYSSRLD